MTEIPTNLVDGAYFESGGEESYGFYWYKFDGSASGLDFNIYGSVNLGSRKVILLVDSANLYLNGNINLTDGFGFFLVVVGKNSGGEKGNIYVDPAASELEGFFLADDVFDTGAGSTQLRVRGSVAGYGALRRTVTSPPIASTSN